MPEVRGGGLAEPAVFVRLDRGSRGRLGSRSKLLLARFWQAKLYYPGGFGEEFRKIQLSKSWIAILVFVVMVIILDRSAGTGFSIFGDLLAILLVFFGLQGLAVIHHRSKALELSTAWLIGLYSFLFLVPQITGLTLGITGIADSMADFRRLKDSSSRE